MRTENVAVVVVGGGSAAFEAAVAAKQAGSPKVVMLEKAPEPEFGGNARYSRANGGSQMVLFVRRATVPQR